MPKALVELVFLRVSQINGCAYCIYMHSRELLKDGMTVDKLVMVLAWREGGALFDDINKKLADLTIAIGLINAYNRMAISFRGTPEGTKL